MEWRLEKTTSLVEYAFIEADSLEELEEKLESEIPNLEWDHDKDSYYIDKFCAYDDNEEEYELDKYMLL